MLGFRGAAGNDTEPSKRSLVSLAAAAMRKSVDTPVSQVDAAAYRVPTDAPEADGTFSWDATTLVVVHLTAGNHTGLGYTYADASVATLVETLANKELKGREALDIPGARIALERAVRNLGRSGLAACAVSALDAALWDLKARLLGLLGEGGAQVRRGEPRG